MQKINKLIRLLTIKIKIVVKIMILKNKEIVLILRYNI